MFSGHLQAIQGGRFGVNSAGFFWTHHKARPKMSGQSSRILMDQLQISKENKYLVLTLGYSLVVRIARPTSLAIWHRARSHRRPNRSRSPNRRHFENTPIFRIAGQHRRIFAEGFSGVFVWFQIKLMWFHIASEKNIFTLLAIWGCAIRIESHITGASRDLGH